jgi:hypothetical protein
MEFNRELARSGIIKQRTPSRLVPFMPVDHDRKRLILARIRLDFPPPIRGTVAKPGGVERDRR